ncbi:MAG: ThiF family adenylyltransferase [Pseudomonadota bacterium]
MSHNIRDQERALGGALRKEKRAALTEPTIFIPRNETSQSAALRRLDQLKSGATRVHDIYEEVLMELLLADRPQLKSAPDRVMEEFREFRNSYANGAPEELAGSWVLYDDGALVHLLHSEDHYRVRTSRNIGLFTREEQARFGKSRVAVCGLSVGGSCVTTLSAEGVRSFFITDFDQLALSNLNRVGSSLMNIGVDKTDIVAKKVWDIDPFARVDTEPRGFNRDSAARLFDPRNMPDVVVDAVDSMQAKIEMRQACREHGVPLVWLMDMGDGLVQIGTERYDLDRNYPPFHGQLQKMRERMGHDLSFAESLLALLNNDRLPSRMADSFVKACNNQGAGISQLAGTVSICAGAIARTVRRILLNERVVPEFFIDVDEKADPDYAHSRARDQQETYRILREMGMRS